MIWKDGIQVVGPAFLVSVAYLDPGNWATAIESGSRFGYRQLWVLVLANLIAIQLQILSSRLGLVSGKHLAQVCRDSYPPIVCRLLWVMTEISIVALDLTMVLGTAVGLNLLFKIDPVTCILLTALDVLALFLLVPQTAVRQAEQWTAVLVFAVLGCFVIDLFISQPPLRAVISGLAPSIRREDLYTAVSLLGANIMPHNFYLHSALVAGQSSRDDKVTARRCYLNSLDVTCALGLALLVNIAVLLVAASAFHSEGVQVATLQEAHDLLEQILNSHLAPLAFGLALLLTGQMSTFTSTIAGQVVMSGFLGLSSSPLSRRLSTRALAVLPALYVQINYGTEGTYKMLVVAQIVLAMQLPFTLIPLIKATSSRTIMGSFASSWITSGTAWAASAAVSIANVLMILDVLWKEASESATDQVAEPKQQSFTDWLILALTTMLESPRHMFTTFSVTVFTGCALALLMWMGVHPVSVQGSLRSPHLKAKPHASGSELATWHAEEPAWDLETGSLDAVTPRAARAMHASRFRCDLSESDAPTPFVQRLFADLPMQYVWRAISSFRNAVSSSPVHAPLTPALLAMHTSAMQPSTPLIAAGANAPPAQVAAPLRASATLSPHLLLDHETRIRIQTLHSRNRSEDAASVSPSMISDISLRSAATLEGAQSLRSSATQATEPGGGKGHRMGRAARKQFAVLVCRVWEKLFDTHGMPYASSTWSDSAMHGASSPESCQPIAICYGHSAAEAVFEGLDELKQIPGIESLLEQPAESNEGLSRWPSQSLLSQPHSGSASVCTKLSRLAGLGEQLTVCAAVVNTACARSAQLHSVLQSASHRDCSCGPDSGRSKSCAGAAAVLLASPDWCSVAEKMCHLWQQLLAEHSDDAPSQPLLGSGHARGHFDSLGHCSSGLQRLQGSTGWCVDGAAALVDASRRGGDAGMLRWSGDASSSGGQSHWGERVKFSSASVESWPSLFFVSFGIWCIAALLQLASVEPRPELWGRYVAGLNHLQGVLFTSVSICAQLRGDSGWAPPGWTTGGDVAALSSFGVHTISATGREPDAERALLGGKHTGRELEAMHKELLHLIQLVDSHVNSCGGSHQRSTNAAAAFAKGKVNIISVIKRLRNHVLSGERYTPGKSVQGLEAGQQPRSKAAGSSWGSGQWRHRSAQGKEYQPERAFGAQRSSVRSGSHRTPHASVSGWRPGVPPAGPHTKGKW